MPASESRTTKSNTLHLYPEGKLILDYLYAGPSCGKSTPVVDKFSVSRNGRLFTPVDLVGMGYSVVDGLPGNFPSSAPFLRQPRCPTDGICSTRMTFAMSKDSSIQPILSPLLPYNLRLSRILTTTPSPTGAVHTMLRFASRIPPQSLCP
jgi:hypothetical protein